MPSATLPTPQESLRKRYGEDFHAGVGAWSDIVSHLLDHRSVRRFRPDPVTDEQLRTLVAAAQSAPTSSNLNAWSVVAVTDAAMRERLAKLAGDQSQIREAPLQLVWLADLSMLKRLSELKQHPVVGLDYLEMFLVGAIDATLAAQNASVAAQSIGLSTVYIGAMRNHMDEVAELLDLPPLVAPVFGMCVGTADLSRPTSIKPRPPQSVVLHRERYSLPAAMEGLQRYEKTMEAFYRSQDMKAESWILRSIKRVATPEALTGRDRLRQMLQRLGFGLK